MPKSVRRFVAVCAVLMWLGLSATAEVHPAGPVMSASEYSAFLTHYDDVVTRWTANFQKIDAATIQVSYSDGDKVMQMRDLMLSELSLMHEWVKAERLRPRLWRQIAMATTLQSVSDMYANLLGMLPQNSVPPDWSDTYLKMLPEGGKLILPLINHVQKRADLLEP